MRASNDAVKLPVAFGRKSLVRVRNKHVTWAELLERLSEPAVGSETLDEYLALGQAEQRDLKNVGWFIGGHCEDNYRTNRNIRQRSIVTLDLDFATPELIDDFEMGLSPLCEFEFAIYSTRKHTREKPRLRVVIPLKRPVDAEAYSPLARLLTARLFPDSTERSMGCSSGESYVLGQLMYLPSRSRDAEFVFLRNEGRLCDPGEVLEAFPTWRDHSTLPWSERREARSPRKSDRKAEDPTEKAGIIGAFCRQYPVERAIETFLPEVYLPGEGGSKPRYTYAEGTTVNGAIVEDDGLFLYSHHGTDPCCNTLVNSWDLVRIHLFSHLDAEARPDTSPGKLPSFEAMVEMASGIPEVVQDMAEANLDVASMFDDFGSAEVDIDDGPGDDIDDLLGPAEPVDGPVGADDDKKPSSEWLKELEIDKNGTIKSTLANVSLIIGHDPRLSRAVEFNEFTQELVTRTGVRSKIELLAQKPVQDKVNGDLWQDFHDRCVRMILESPRGKGKPGYGIKVSDRDVVSAVDLVGNRNAFHPVKEYFEKLRWDGKERLERLFIDFLCTPDTPYYREVARLTLLAAVTRVYEPGHKYDYMVIVEGLQGKRKSTFFNILAKNWFTEMNAGFDDAKKAVETTRGALIAEVAELSQFRKTEVTQIKAFVSRAADKVRLSYERREKVFPRQCIFVGTTNDDAYLRDTTGNRRFLPVKCELPGEVEIDTDRLKREADQLWAEAVVLYRRMRDEQPYGTLPLFLRDKASQRHALALQDSRMVETEEDAMIGLIQAWLDTPVRKSVVEGTAATSKFENHSDDADPEVLREETCAIEVWLELFEGTKESFTRGNQLKMGRTLRRVPGWEYAGIVRTKKFGVQRTYRRIDLI